ncbi:unnamed protein product [Strongylus vulgaris]|uniref:Uncharacterized protein n=1 Tax=Strongylus vulgaris TaxID=40348 RepID=A0A3P7J482_STRVU|nr:unnamed protein product [Strongylus vulgaris]
MTSKKGRATDALESGQCGIFLGFKVSKSRGFKVIVDGGGFRKCRAVVFVDPKILAMTWKKVRVTVGEAHPCALRWFSEYVDGFDRHGSSEDDRSKRSLPLKPLSSYVKRLNMLILMAAAEMKKKQSHPLSAIDRIHWK